MGISANENGAKPTHIERTTSTSLPGAKLSRVPYISSGSLPDFLFIQEQKLSQAKIDKCRSLIKARAGQSRAHHMVPGEVYAFQFQLDGFRRFFKRDPLWIVEKSRSFFRLRKP